MTNLGGGYDTTVSGILEATGTSIDSFAVINSSTGNNQNLIFDVPTFTAVPETFRGGAVRPGSGQRLGAPPPRLGPLGPFRLLCRLATPDDTICN